jgi:5-formyltetrahydrofolate cyclo-ligase
MKTELRAAMRAIRKAHVAAIGGNALLLGSALINRLNAFILQSKITAAYSATPTECDVMTALEALPLDHERLCLPCASCLAEPLTFRRWHPGEVLQKSALGFWQPCDTEEIVTPDLFLTPLLAFDRALNRLGQGAGHYDRAFAAHPTALRIGIAWACQEIDAVPTDPWDLSLDAVITENEWICPPDSRIGQF